MIRRRRFAAMLLCAVIGGAPLAQAWADDEEEKAAEAALARGDARPIDDLLARVRPNFTGRVLKIELEQEDDGDVPWIYEVKLLTPDGDVLELEYAAATLELIALEGRYREREDDD